MSKVMKDYKYHFGLKLRIYPDYHQRKIKVAVKMLRLLTENSERNKRQHFSDDEVALIDNYRILDDNGKQTVKGVLRLAVNNSRQYRLPLDNDNHVEVGTIATPTNITPIQNVEVPK